MAFDLTKSGAQVPVHGPFTSLDAGMQAALTADGIPNNVEVMVLTLPEGATTRLLEACAEVAVVDGPNLVATWQKHNVLAEIMAVFKAVADEQLAEGGFTN